MKYSAATHTHTRHHQKNKRDRLNYQIIFRWCMNFHRRQFLINFNQLFCCFFQKVLDLRRVRRRNSTILNLAGNPLSTCAAMEMWQNCRLIRGKWRCVRVHTAPVWKLSSIRNTCCTIWSQRALTWLSNFHAIDHWCWRESNVLFK